VVLSNLLANAVSYTERGSVALSSRGGTVEITDTGPGMAPDASPTCSAASIAAMRAAATASASAWPSSSASASRPAGRSVEPRDGGRHARHSGADLTRFDIPMTAI
jgi:hypothetical protein